MLLRLQGAFTAAFRWILGCHSPREPQNTLIEAPNPRTVTQHRNGATGWGWLWHGIAAPDSTASRRPDLAAAPTPTCHGPAFYPEGRAICRIRTFGSPSHSLYSQRLTFSSPICYFLFLYFSWCALFLHHFLLSFFSRWVYLFFFIASSLYIPLNILCVLQLSILFSSNFAHFFPFFPLPYFIFSRFISLYLFFLFSFARPSLPLCPASLTYSVPPLNHVLPTPTQHLLRAPHPASCVGRHVARSLYCKEYSKRCPVPSR